MAACNSPKKLQRHVHNQILSPPSTSQLSFSRTNLLPSHRHLPVVIAECRLHSVLITSLDCRFCMLNKLSITTLCSHLVNLEELKVVDCGLKELDQGIPWPDRLKCIDFSRNQLIQCPQGISSLLYLQTLNLSGNLIQQLDPSLLRLPLLHSLHVLCNPIQNVPKHICRSGVFKLREYFDTNVLPLPQPSISLATTNPLPISNGLRNPPSVVDLKRCQDLRRLLLRQQGSFDSGYESSRRCRSTSGSSIETVDSDLTDPTLCPLLQHFQLPEGYSPAVKTTLCQVFLPEDCADGVKVEVVKDLSLHPDVRPNELLVTPVVQITPHGRTFTTEQPAIVVLPHCTKQGSGSGTRPHLVPVCSDSRLSQPTAWGKLDGDPSCEMFQDHIVFKTTHFSLFAVLAVLPYPSASKTISPDYGGLLIVPELPGFEVSLPPTLSHTLTVTATVYYDDAPYIIEGDGKTLASPCVGLEPHGATFDAPVSISLPIPNYKEITAKFPNAKLELWCDPSLRCFVDIFNQYTCQYLPPICTTDDDCFGSGFCGNAIPSYGSNYFESDIVEIPGEESTYISQAERFDGVRIIRRPATDHPNLDTGLTITTYIQQDPSNSGYVIAKGFDDQMRDWGLLLAYNRIAIVYRTNTGSYETITFSGITVADGYNYSVSAVIDGTNNQAFISVNGEVTAITLNRQPEFRPGFNFLYIGGRPETTETADNRFKGTIYHLSVYDSALSIDDIQKLDAEFQPNFVNPIELTTTRYCRDYVGFNGYCYLGDDRDFRCKPPARCVPVVINGNTAVQLPKQGESFSASDIIGRCVTPCACDDDPTSNQVCGSDGRTYASACYADCANIEVVENGACTMTYAELYNRQ